MPSPEQTPLLDRPDRKIFITGRGLVLSQSIGQRILDLSGGKRVLINAGPSESPEWHEKYVKKVTGVFKDDLKANVEVLNEQFEVDPGLEEIRDKVGRADVIWTIGGSSVLNNEFMKRTGADQVMRDALHVVHAGGSAGATNVARKAMSWYTPHGHPEQNEMRIVDGQGYLDVFLTPHSDLIEREDGLIVPRINFFKNFLEDPAFNIILPGLSLALDNDATLAFNGEGGIGVFLQDGAIKHDGTDNPIGLTVLQGGAGNIREKFVGETSDFISVDQLKIAA